MRRGLAGVAASAALALLAACGGGGGGGGGGGSSTGGGSTVPGGGTNPGGSVTPADPPVRVSSTSPFGQFCDGTLSTVALYPGAEVEPQLAINPRNPNNLVGVWQQDRWGNGSARAIGVGVSTDGGMTWQTRAMPFSRCGGGTAQNGGDYIRVSDPWVTFGPEGIVYQAALSSSGGSFQPGSINSILASRSVDGGLTWSNPVPLITDGGGFFNDKNSITADTTDPRFVYAVWDRLPTGSNSGPSYLARSVDRGVNWEAARPIYDPGSSAQTINNQVVVLTDGTLVNFFTQLDVGANSIVTASMAIVRSTDKGATWTGRVRITDVFSVGTRDPEAGTRVRDGTQLGSIAAGLQGSLHVAWQDGRANGGVHDDVLYSRSLDGGLTWSSPVRVNAAPSVPAFTPTIAVRADGTVGITYYDFRSNTPDPLTLPTDYWLTRSSDGINWRESRVAAAFDLAIAPNANGLFLGDYQGLGTIDNVFVPFFAQTGGGNLANPTDVWSVVSRNGSVATGDVSLKQAPVQRIGDDTPALRRAAHDSIVNAMEARVPGWSARSLAPLAPR